MDFPVFLNKWIIGFRHIRYTPFWWWYRLMSHEGFRFDDYHVWKEFWSSLNHGYLDMNYKHEFESFWGKDAKPERILLKQQDFDALVERLSLPSEATMESIKRLVNRKAPWDNNND